jgi:hypothetical protein
MVRENLASFIPLPRRERLGEGEITWTYSELP